MSKKKAKVATKKIAKPAAKATTATPAKAKPAKKGKADAAATTPEATTAVETAASEPAPAEKATQPDKPKRMSALDAAAQILREVAEAKSCGELITMMQEQGLWSSPNGRTPAATLYSAILREIEKKGDESRFRKTERGRFECSAEIHL